jgi:hypothetical protein
MLGEYAPRLLFQDHPQGAKHTNVDTLTRNFVGMPKEDEEFQVKLLSMKAMILSMVGKEKEWRGVKSVNLTLNKSNKLIWGKSSDFVIKNRLNYSTKACWYPSLKRENYW